MKQPIRPADGPPSSAVGEWLGTITRNLIDRDANDDYVREIAKRRAEAVHPADIAAFWAASALLLADLGRGHEALEHAIASVTVLADADVNNLHLARNASVVAVIAIECGDIETASEYITLSLKGAADASLADDADALSRIANNAGAVFAAFEAFDLAIDQFRLSADADELLGNPSGAEVSILNAVDSQVRAAQHAAICGHADLERKLLAQALVDAHWMCGADRTPGAREKMGPVCLVAVYAQMRRDRDAREIIDRLHEPMVDCDDPAVLGLWGPARARVALREKRIDEAKAAVEQMLGSEWIATTDIARAEALRLTVEVREASGDTLGALVALREADVLSRKSAVNRLSCVAPVLMHRVALESTNRRLAIASETDPLSGLLNRRGLERIIGDSKAGTEDERRCTVLMLDLDEFKSTNDTYGHHIGDAVLRSVAAIMREHTRPHDLVARIGGEEFVIVLTDGDIEQSMEIAERVRLGIQGFDWDTIKPGLTTTVSVGVTTGPRWSFSTLLRDADSAMYTAKRTGRNQILRFGT